MVEQISVEVIGEVILSYGSKVWSLNGEAKIRISAVEMEHLRRSAKNLMM